jgi:hypothetical protein
MVAIKMKALSGFVLFILILIWAVIALAAATQATSEPSWFEHVDLMQIIIAGLFMLILWFLTRTLRKIDGNQSLLFSKLDAVCKDFYTLQGEHQALKNRCHD